MRVDVVEAVPLACPLEEPMWHGGFRIRERAMVLVRIHGDNGMIGYGEAGCVNSDPLTVTSFIERELAPILLDKDALGRLSLMRQMLAGTKSYGGPGMAMHAISGIDMALWDIAGKAAGMPLWKLLGADNAKVDVYATGGLYQRGKGLDGLVGEMQRLVESGFRGVKMKVGLDPKDAERIRMVKAALGEGCRLNIDANGAYTPKQALSLLGSLEGVDLGFFEEPVDPSWPEGLAEFRKACSLPVSGGENLATLPAYKRFLQSGAVDILQADTTRCGGIGPAMAIASLAEAYNSGFALHSFSSALGLAANLHVAAATGAVLTEVDQTPNPLRTDLAMGLNGVDADGMLEAPDGPGLGLGIDEALVRCFRLDR